MSQCSRCQNPSDRKGQRLCKTCHAASMRAWRLTHALTAIQRFKDACRSYASVYLKRGKIQKLPCEQCGEENSQMHHPDYGKPLLVVWLCRVCHLALHAESAP